MKSKISRTAFVANVATPALLVIAFGIGAITWDMKFRDAATERDSLRKQIEEIKFQMKQARLVTPDDAPEFYRLQTGMDAKLDEILALLKKS